MMNKLLHDFRQDGLESRENKNDPAAIEEIFARRGTTERIPWHGQGHEGGSDRFVSEVLLPLKYEGRFFEMGAYNGWDSNTWYFEYKRAWTGVMVEANVAMHGHAKLTRKKVELHLVAIDKQEGFLVNIQGAGAGTITTCAAREPTDEDRKVALLNNEKHQDGEQLGELGIPCKPINKVLEKAGPFDYVSLDCEGCEKAGVLTWDFEQNPAGIVQMEMMDQEMMDVMREEGYAYLGHFVDHIWVKKGYVFEQNKEHWDAFCGASDIDGWHGGAEENRKVWHDEMAHAKHQARMSSKKN